MQVQKLRLKRGWSQQQLAELTGLSVRTIQRIENGQKPSVESLKSLASVFEIDFTTLTSETEAMDTNAAAMDEKIALSKVRKLKGFYIHLIQYVVVILGLCAINLFTSPNKLWFFWPAIGWGLGILIHAAAVFELAPFFGAEWERKQVEQRLGRKL